MATLKTLIVFFLLSFNLYRDYFNPLTLSIKEAEVMQRPPVAENEKKKWDKKSVMHVQRFACVLPAPFAPLGEMLSRTYFPVNCICVFGCIFHLGLVPDKKFEAHYRKVSLKKLPRMTKQGYNAYNWHL